MNRASWNRTAGFEGETVRQMWERAGWVCHGVYHDRSRRIVWLFPLASWGIGIRYDRRAWLGKP